MQQNQIKKARKLQEDAKAEHERLVAGRLAVGCLRAELQTALA